MSFDPVTRPKHYNVGAIQPWDAIEAWGLDFTLGNAVKYIARHEHKGTPLEDLRKARVYLDRAIAKREREDVHEQAHARIRDMAETNAMAQSDDEDDIGTGADLELGEILRELDPLPGESALGAVVRWKTAFVASSEASAAEICMLRTRAEELDKDLEALRANFNLVGEEYRRALRLVDAIRVHVEPFRVRAQRTNVEDIVGVIATDLERTLKMVERLTEQRDGAYATIRSCEDVMSDVREIAGARPGENIRTAVQRMREAHTDPPLLRVTLPDGTVIQAIKDQATIVMPPGVGGGSIARAKPDEEHVEPEKVDEAIAAIRDRCDSSRTP